MKTGTSIMLAEDDREFAAAVSLVLEQAGYRIAGVARDCARALELAEDRGVALAILDLRLEGDIDGVTLGIELSARGIGVIYLTGDVTHAVTQAYALAEDFLTKPLRSADLLKAVEKAVARNRPRQGITPRHSP